MYIRVYTERNASVGGVVDVLHQTVVYLPELTKYHNFSANILLKKLPLPAWTISAQVFGADIFNFYLVRTAIIELFHPCTFHADSKEIAMPSPMMLLTSSNLSRWTPLQSWVCWSGRRCCMTAPLCFMYPASFTLLMKLLRTCTPLYNVLLLCMETLMLLSSWETI